MHDWLLPECWPDRTGEFDFVQTSGAEFWKVGSAASGFTGDSGRKRLALRIQTVIPKPADEINL